MVDLAVAFAQEAPAEVDVTVQHLDSAVRAQDLVDALRTRLPAAREVGMGELGAVIGAHVGPGTLAVVVSPVVRIPRPGSALGSSTSL